jgi:hypothetical protein
MRNFSLGCALNSRNGLLRVFFGVGSTRLVLNFFHKDFKK